MRFCGGILSRFSTYLPDGATLRRDFESDRGLPISLKVMTLRELMATPAP